MKYLSVVFISLLLLGCAKPLDQEKLEFVGLWLSNQTSLLITKAGRVEYKSQKGAVSTSVSMPIKSIDDSGMEAGFLFFSSSFKFAGKPQDQDGMQVLVVDGETLFKTDAQGRIPKATLVPALSELRPLAENQLALLSSSIKQKDFSSYLENSSIIFQDQFTSEKLMDVYKPFMEKNIDLDKWMVGDFVLTSEPMIDENGVLRINGKFPTSPNSLKFSLSYVYSHPNWKGLGANIDINRE